MKKVKQAAEEMESTPTAGWSWNLNVGEFGKAQQAEVRKPHHGAAAFERPQAIAGEKHLVRVGRIPRRRTAPRNDDRALKFDQRGVRWHRCETQAAEQQDKYYQRWQHHGLYARTGRFFIGFMQILKIILRYGNRNYRRSIDRGGISRTGTRGG